MNKKKNNGEYMQKPIILIPIENLSYSQEIFLNEESKANSCVIKIIAALFLVAILWITFGSMEEVVQGKGVVRPLSNISQIRSAVSGEILELYYTQGQYVNEGDLLLRINTNALESKQKSLELAIEELSMQINGLLQMKESFYKNKILIDKKNIVAQTRFQNFLNQKEILEKQYLYAKTLWEESLALPDDATTNARRRELEHELNLYSLNLQNMISSFIKEITLEHRQCVLELKDLESNLQQVKQNIKNSSVRAPVSGIVHELSSLNKNDFIFSEQNILHIVPSTSENHNAEIRIPAKMAGKIKVGMKAKLRFPAFSFYEFGGSFGNIVALSPDAEADNTGNLFFTAIVNIDNPILKDRKQFLYPIRNGLEVDARIILEKQRLIYYILKKLDVVWY